MCQTRPNNQGGFPLFSPFRKPFDDDNPLPSSYREWESCTLTRLSYKGDFAGKGFQPTKWRQRHLLWMCLFYRAFDDALILRDMGPARAQIPALRVYMGAHPLYHMPLSPPSLHQLRATLPALFSANSNALPWYRYVCVYPPNCVNC